MGFMDDIQSEANQYGGASRGGNKFEFEKEGVYKMRILVKPSILATHFFGAGKPSSICIGIDKGCPFHGKNAPKNSKGGEQAPSLKLVTYIIDRGSKEVKLAELPLSLSYGLNDLQKDDDFAFDGWPMPFDIKITYDPNNSDPKAKYRMQPAPLREEVTEEEVEKLSECMKKMTPEQYVEKRKAKQIEKSGAPAAASGEDVDKEWDAMGNKPAYPEGEVNPDDIPF